MRKVAVVGAAGVSGGAGVAGAGAAARERLTAADLEAPSGPEEDALGVPTEAPSGAKVGAFRVVAPGRDVTSVGGGGQHVRKYQNAPARHAPPASTTIRTTRFTRGILAHRRVRSVSRAVVLER